MGYLPVGYTDKRYAPFIGLVVCLISIVIVIILGVVVNIVVERKRVAKQVARIEMLFQDDCEQLCKDKCLKP